MATPKSTRIGIVLIAIMMVIGTIGSFAVFYFADKNQAIDNKRNQEAVEKWQKSYEEYQAKLEAQDKELSDKYFDDFKQYADRPAKYDKDSIKELTKNDLKVGGGAEIDGKTKFAAYYIGWNSDGKVFDGSIDGDRLKSPLRIDDGLDQASLIEGWKDGMKGMKIGGIRELVIPSEIAYGEAGSGNDIPPNMPIKFVVMVIDLPEEISQPEISDAVLRGVQNGQVQF